MMPTKDWYVQALENVDKRRCRTWRIKIACGEYADGRTRYATRKYSGTYSMACEEAERWFVEDSKRRAAEEGTERGWTVRAWAEHVNDTKLDVGQITKRTHDKNQHFINGMCLHIGDMDMTDVRPADLDRAYRKLRKGDTVSGKPWSGTTLFDCSVVFWGIFDQAVGEEIIARNPVSRSHRPKPDTKEKASLPMWRVAEFVDALDPTERHQLALIIAAEGGLRLGEVCALRWSDVGDGTMHIAHSLGTDGKLGKCKGKEVRDVPISPTLARALERAPRHGEWVCADVFGNQLGISPLSHWWRRHRGEYGLDGFTIHQLRHTFTTNMIEAGLDPKVTQQIVGHQSAMTTLNIYTHVRSERMVAAVDALDAAKRAALEEARSAG